MFSFSLLILMGLVLLITVAFLARQATNTQLTLFPYLAADTLFTAAERSFLGVLDQAVGEHHRVFGKVRVADVVAVRAGLSASVRQRAFNKIAAKHFDFIVCRAADLAVVCAVELNDRSHSSRKAQARDALLSGICKVASLPLLTIPAQHSYVIAELQTLFRTTLSRDARVAAASDV